MEGQRKLRRARVLVIGAGGLGSPTLSYLAAAGVGTLGIVDFDTVDFTNLQRQIIYTTDDVGQGQAGGRGGRVRSHESRREVEPIERGCPPRTPWRSCGGYDVVVDGTDNYPTRYLVNDACVMLGIPNVYGSIFRFEGQASVFCRKDGPCYRCVYPRRRPRGSCRAAPRAASSGCCPGSSARSRPRRR